jgi:hypothetical protein
MPLNDLQSWLLPNDEAVVPFGRCRFLLPNSSPQSCDITDFRPACLNSLKIDWCYSTHGLLIFLLDRLLDRHISQHPR